MVTKAKKILDEWLSEVLDNLKKGYAVNLPLINSGYSRVNDVVRYYRRELKGKFIVRSRGKINFPEIKEIIIYRVGDYEE